MNKPLSWAYSSVSSITGAVSLITSLTFFVGTDAQGDIYAVTNANPAILVKINTTTWVSTAIYTFPAGITIKASVADNGILVFINGASNPAIVYSVGPYTGTYLTTPTTLFTASTRLAGGIEVNPSFTTIHGCDTGGQNLYKYTNWNGSTATTVTAAAAFGGGSFAVSPTGNIVSSGSSGAGIFPVYYAPSGGSLSTMENATGVGAAGLHVFDNDGLPIVGKTVGGIATLYKYTSPPSSTTIQISAQSLGTPSSSSDGLVFNRGSRAMYICANNVILVFTPNY